MSLSANPLPENTRKNSALKIARKGIPVFPGKPDKSPYTLRGFKDATTDPAKVCAYWTRYPEANICMPTGNASGVDVVDVDRLEALEELDPELRQELAVTLTVRTPSGGLHYYLKHTEGITNRTGALPDDIDVRGEGGYVIVPPSEGYTIEKRAPISDTPDRLLELLQWEPAQEAGSHGDTQRSRRSFGATTVDLESTSPIPEGGRNNTLASIGGKLRAYGFDRAEIEDALLRINAERCTPPLPDGEARSVANSVSRYERGKGTPPPDTATLAALDAIEEGLWAAPWPKVGGKSERSATAVVLKLGRRCGRLLPDGRVEVSVSRRALALAAATSRKSVDRVLKRSTWLARGRQGSGTNSGTIIISTPWGGGSAKVPHSNHGEYRSSEVVASGDTLRAPFTAPRLRWSAPGILRLGKSAEAAIDFLEQLGGSATVDDLAELLHVARTRDFRRRVVDRLEERGIVTVSGDTVALVEDWLEALNRERETSGEIAAYQRDMERFNRERRGYRNRIQNSPDRAPSQREMEAFREGYPERRRGAIEAALGMLFRGHPASRGRRVGQITCRLVDYLSPDFPRGPDGAPKDAEVEAILDGNAGKAAS